MTLRMTSIVLASLALAGCVQTQPADNFAGIGDHTMVLGQALEYNKACQTDNGPLPRDCRRTRDLVREAEASMAGYGEFLKAGSDLRVRPANLSRTTGN